MEGQQEEEEEEEEEEVVVVVVVVVAVTGVELIVSSFKLFEPRNR